MDWRRSIVSSSGNNKTEIENTMSNGLWIVFEGCDGSGKSSTMAAVAEKLRDRRPELEIIETRHPGSTTLGAHIRDIVKYPEKHGFKIDALSSQMLMFVDHVNFKNTVLLPALERGAVVLADRCDLISGLVYGMATGLDATQYNTLVSLVSGPLIDRLYVLDCPSEVLDKRLGERGKGDRFETKEGGMRSRVENEYRKLITGSVDRTILLNRIVPLYEIKFCSTLDTLNQIAENVASDINKKLGQLLGD